MKRFQLLGTAEEMTGVEATFVEWHNDRMEVRGTFIQVHPLCDNAPPGCFSLSHLRARSKKAERYLGEAVFHHSGDAVNMNSTAFTASRRKAFDCFAWACSMTLPTAATTPAEPEQAAPKERLRGDFSGSQPLARDCLEWCRATPAREAREECFWMRRMAKAVIAPSCQTPPGGCQPFPGCTHYTSPRGVMSFAAYCRPEGVRDIPVYQARRRPGMLLGHCPRTSPQAR